MGGESKAAAMPRTDLPPADKRAGRLPSKILLLTPRWARDGGVGAHVMASAAALAQAGVEVTVLVARSDSQERIPGVALCERARLLDRTAVIEERLQGALDGSPALAHLHQVDDPDLVQALREVAPVVVSAHGYTACTSGVHYFRPGHECTRPHGPGCVPNLLACSHVRNPAPLARRYRNATRGLRALQTADLAVSYSSSVDRHLADNDIGHRAIVPYFPTIAPLTQAAPKDPRRVVFAGRVIPAKGADVLIRAAAGVQAEVYICGDGRQVDALRRLARRLHVAQRVHFTGWLAPPQLAEQLTSASVAVLPSVWPEPFGLVGIEALAAGTPAIASATGGVRDWLQDGVNGLAVAPADVMALARALDALLADPERQRSMAAAGRQLVTERFSQRRHLAALREAYAAARRSWQPPAGGTEPKRSAPVVPAAPA